MQEVLEIVPGENGSFLAESVASHETSDAVMNSTICQIEDSRHCFIAAGIEDMCEMYRMEYTIQSPEVSNGSVEHNEAATNEGSDPCLIMKFLIPQSDPNRSSAIDLFEADHDTADVGRSR